MRTIPASNKQKAMPSDAGHGKSESSDFSRASLRAVTTERQQTVAANEEELAGYLIENPGFFVRHAEVLVGARVPDPHAGRAISLHERQLDVLRKQNAAAQQKFDELMIAAKENEVIAQRLTSWTRQLLLVRDPLDMPARIVDGLLRIFSVPCVALRVWDIDDQILARADDGGGKPVYFEAVDASTRRMTNNLTNPYCGLRGDIAQARWLADGGVNVRSVALLSLRSGISPNAYGLIVLGSPDADRFQAGMGTEFLERIAQTASAALYRLTCGGKDSPIIG